MLLFGGRWRAAEFVNSSLGLFAPFVCESRSLSMCLPDGQLPYTLLDEQTILSYF